MASVHFRDAKLYLAPTSAAAAVPIVEANSFSLSIDREEVDDVAFGDTWKEVMSGPISWSGSFGAGYDNTLTTPFAAATQVLGPVRFYGYPALAAAATQYYYGLAWIKLGIEGDVSSKGTLDISLTGSGALSTN